MRYFDSNNEPDWVSTNESNGQSFYGYDSGNGYTNWYDSDGNLDSRTETPSDYDCDDYLSWY